MFPDKLRNAANNDTQTIVDNHSFFKFWDAGSRQRRSWHCPSRCSQLAGGRRKIYAKSHDTHGKTSGRTHRAAQPNKLVCVGVFRHQFPPMTDAHFMQPALRLARRGGGATFTLLMAGTNFESCANQIRGLNHRPA
jgi:hypothetical protein